VKKYLVIVLGVICILSFAVTASAEVTLGGKLLPRGWYFDNISSLSGHSCLPTEAESDSMYTTNVFLSVDARVADNVRGFVELETGTSSTSGIYWWGGDSSINDAKAGEGNLWFRQAWLQYTGSGLLGIPSGMKIGHMLLTLGEKQFFNHERFGDDAILLWIDPTKELHLEAATVKLAEGYLNQDGDDIDAYAVVSTYKVNKDNTVGVNYAYLNRSNDKLSLQNLGLHANGVVSGVKYAAEADFQFGEKGTTDYTGYGILAKLGYMLDPVNLRASFALGSGDSDGTGKNSEFQAIVGTDYHAVARFAHYTQLYERAISTAADYQTVTGNFRTTGIANTTYYNLGVDVDPVKDLGLSLDGYYLRATNVASGVSKYIGSEVDLTGSYKIAKNLSYFVQAGLFTPGKYYDSRTADKKTATMAVHGLSLTF